MPTAGQFSGEGVPVNLLVMIAYDVQESQIAGGPSWFASEKWDITAKCDDAQHSFDETKRMLQHLLEERFSLKIHRESRQRPVYALTIAKGGPKFKTTEKNATNIGSGPHSISMERGSMARMAAVLATAVGRPVADRTGLADFYDLSVIWDDAPVRDAGVPGTQTSEAGDSPAGGDHGSIFTAVQEQLGLRLDPSRAAVDVIVIDGVERPSAN